MLNSQFLFTHQQDCFKTFRAQPTPVRCSQWEMSRVRVLQYSCHGKYACSIPTMFGMSLYWQSITSITRVGYRRNSMPEKWYYTVFLIRWNKMIAILNMAYLINISLFKYVVFCGNIVSNLREFMFLIYIISFRVDWFPSTGAIKLLRHFHCSNGWYGSRSVSSDKIRQPLYKLLLILGFKHDVRCSVRSGARRDH